MRVIAALVGVLSLLACGSAGDGELFESQGGASATGATGSADSAVPTGGTTSSGGSSSSAGGTPATGGTLAAGGTTGGGAGGIPTFIVDGGSTTPLGDGGGGVQVDGSIVPGQLPTGIIISQECADCAATLCPQETAACTADPACVAGIECLNTCILPALCGACFVVSGVTSVPAPIPELNACAAKACPMCPTLG